MFPAMQVDDVRCSVLQCKLDFLFLGLLFLSMEPSTCNGLIRTLLDNSGNDNEEDDSDMPTLKQYMRTSDIGEQCTPHHIGLLLVYHLKSLESVDTLMRTAKPGELIIFRSSII